VETLYTIYKSTPGSKLRLIKRGLTVENSAVMILTNFGVREFTITGVVNGIWDQRIDRWELCIEATQNNKSFRRSAADRVFIPFVSISPSTAHTAAEAWKELAERFIEQALLHPIKLDGLDCPTTTHVCTDDDWNQMMCATGIAA
jgi:hypothetical protein